MKPLGAGQFPDGFFLHVLLTACFSACHDRFLPVFDTGNDGITIDIPFLIDYSGKGGILFIDKAGPENSLGDMTTRKRISSPKHEKKKYGEKETGEKERL